MAIFVFVEHFLYVCVCVFPQRHVFSSNAPPLSSITSPSTTSTPTSSTSKSTTEESLEVETREIVEETSVNPTESKPITNQFIEMSKTNSLEMNSLLPLFDTHYAMPYEIKNYGL